MPDRSVAYLYGGTHKEHGNRRGPLIPCDWLMRDRRPSDPVPLDRPPAPLFVETPYMVMPRAEELTYWIGFFEGDQLVQRMHVEWLIPGGSVITKGGFITLLDSKTPTR